MSPTADPTAFVKVLDCNAADLHADAHVWDFGSGEHFVCFGTPCTCPDDDCRETCPVCLSLPDEVACVRQVPRVISPVVTDGGAA